MYYKNKKRLMSFERSNNCQLAPLMHKSKTNKKKKIKATAFCFSSYEIKKGRNMCKYTKEKL